LQDFEDICTKELLGIISLKGRTMGKEIFNLIFFITKSNVPLHTFFSITTKGQNQ
jgi:hypothetical protein